MLKLSIVIPCHNAAKFIRECLDSVARQTLQEFEVICIDDGSTDGTAATLDEYAEQDGRFVVEHIEPSGVSVARNQGIAKATGDYIGFVEALLPLASDMDAQDVTRATIWHTAVSCSFFVKRKALNERGPKNGDQALIMV